MGIIAPLVVDTVAWGQCVTEVSGRGGHHRECGNVSRDACV